MIGNEPLIYDGGGEGIPCGEFIERQGGWDAISAAEASLLASMGCTPGPLSGEPRWTADQFEEVGGGGGFVGDAAPASTSTGGTDVNFGAVLNPIDIALMTGGATLTGPQWSGIGQAIGDIFDTVSGTFPVGQNPVLMQNDPFGDVVGGASTTAVGGLGVGALSCFNSKNSRRRKIKIVRTADGQLHPVPYCTPRRMNPLNARALGRAARRLGSFHRIAQGIEKMVQKACKTGTRGRRVSRAPYCGPKRKGC